MGFIKLDNKRLEERENNIKTRERRAFQFVDKVYNSLMEFAEKDLAKKGWAKTWQELEDKFPADFPEDNLPDSVKDARNLMMNWRRATTCLHEGPGRSAQMAIFFMIEINHYFREQSEQIVRNEINRIANEGKTLKQEKLYGEALKTAEKLYIENPLWNNVQISDEIMKSDKFKPLSLRELKKRVLELFPDRNHRQNRK